MHNGDRGFYPLLEDEIAVYSPEGGPVVSNVSKVPPTYMMESIPREEDGIRVIRDIDVHSQSSKV